MDETKLAESTFADFRTVLRPGTFAYYDNKRIPIIVQVEYKAGKLSFTAVEGPLNNGNCLGSCGQATDGLTDSTFEPGKGWDRATVALLVQAWERWHLNDMRPYTAAMREADWHEKAKLAMHGHRFTLLSEVSSEQRTIKESSLARLQETGAARLSAKDRATLALPYDLVIWQYADESPPACPRHYKAGDYKGERLIEHKTLGWLYPLDQVTPTQRDGHIHGLLGARLDGLAYGGAWYKESVPDSVLSWLAGLPCYHGKVSWYNWHGDYAMHAIGDRLLVRGHYMGTLERKSEANRQFIIACDDGQERVAYPCDVIAPPG